MSTCDFFLMPSDLPRYAGCIGRPSPGVRFRIVGDDGDTPISPAIALWLSPSSRLSRLRRPPRYSFRSGAGMAGTLS